MLSAAVAAVLSLPNYPIGFLLSVLWYALWISKDWRRRKYYAQAIAHWPDEDLPGCYAFYLDEVRTYQRASFPKSSWRKAEDALIMATVLSERIDRIEGRTWPGYLRMRARVLRAARNG